MLKYIPVILLLLFGCAGKDVVEKNVSSKVPAQDSAKSKRQAMDHFINGTVFESKGEYASAILEFQEALMKDESAGIYYALAKNYYALGKNSLALQNGKKAVQLSPDQKEYHSLLGEILFMSHQPDSAAVIYEKIIGMDSTDINALYRLAGIYERSKPSQAAIIYKRILIQVGPEWNVLARLSEIYEKLGNYQEAAVNLQKMTEIDPSNNSIKKVLIELYVKDKNYTSALEVINDIQELNPDDYEVRERKAQLFIEQNDWVKAGEEYKFLLSLPKVPLETRIRIGAAYFAQSFKDSTLLGTARDIFNNIDKDTTDWQTKLFLGAISLNEKKDSAAEKYFKDVVTLAQYNPQGWIQLGGLYFDNQRYDEAVKVLTQATELYPQDFVLNLLLGLSYAQNEKHNEAVKYLETAVDVNSNDVTALSAYAYTLSQLKENEKAIEYLNKALVISPDDVNLLGTLGLIYDSLEKWEECDSTYERALKIDSTNALVNNNFAYSLSERDLQLERALKMAKVAVTAEPENSSYLDTIGWVYFKLARYDEAEKYLRKALEVAGDRPVILEHLGDVIFKQGRTSEAADLWEKAYSLDTSNVKLKTKIEKGEI